MKKRVLSMLMALIMVFSLMPTAVFAADTYAIGDYVIGEKAPEGVIPENSEWIGAPITMTDVLVCENGEEAPEHFPKPDLQQQQQQQQQKQRGWGHDLFGNLLPV